MTNDRSALTTDLLDEILKLAEELASARVQAFWADDRSDPAAVARHENEAAGHRLALAVLVSAVRAAGVAEGRRRRAATTED